ncbi:hypothetical protein LEN26_015348 [Aphanomyces euteiches]|nr:hypothetical protein LEN26_015348 [Aphanomyces euteiches]
MEMLPVDIIIKIAFLLPDLKDVFALLNALRPHIALEPLEYLYQLSLTHDHSSLWTTLTLASSMNDTISIVLYESIAKYYSSVVVEDSWFSIDWLKKHLHSMATIQWDAQEFPLTDDNVDEWADLRITDLYLSINNATSPSWKKLLPRLHHLKSLRVEGLSGDVKDIYKIVATSAQITELTINPIDLRIDNAELLYLIEWFRRQPVRSLLFWFANWRELNYDLRQELCEAIFNCSTMDKLILTDCYLDDLDFTRFSFSMTTLSLYSHCFHGDCLKLLASRLKDSKLTNLELADRTVQDDMDGMQ